MTAEHFDVVTEAKPDVTVTIELPKEHGGNLKGALKTAFSDLDWVRYIEITDSLDVTPTSETLRVTGSFFLTAHFPPDQVDPEPDETVTAVREQLDQASFITDVETVTLRMPPYRIEEY